MGSKNPKTNYNEILAPALVPKAFKLISRLLVFVGKPFFFLFSLLLIISLSIIYITGRILKALVVTLHSFFTLIFPSISKYLTLTYDLIRTSSKKITSSLPQKNLKKKGTIFSSSQLKLKIMLLILKRIINNLLRESLVYFKKIKVKSEKLSWKAEVFLLTLEKLISKFFVILKTKFTFFHLLELLQIFLLAQKIKLLRLSYFLPKLRIRKFSILKFLTYIFTFSLIILGMAGAFFWFYVIRDLPSPQNLISRKMAVSTKIYDRNGGLLYNIYRNQNRTPVSLRNIPLEARLATIAIEDAEFYNHPGFSIKGIARASLKNLRQGELTGGSTITQQLVKNTLLSPEKTLVRKLKEIVLAVQVELTFSKDQILEMYMNEVSYGGTAYGVQTASLTYFGKDIKDLNLAEAALLAGLPKSPTYYSPFGPNPEKAKERQKEVLKLMKINGFITEKQKKSAETHEIKFAQNQTSIKAPHYVFYVRELLEQKYSKELVEAGGLEVTTSLDLQIQNLAENIVKEEIEKLKSLNVTNAAVLVLNPKTGEVLAMVGSKDYFSIAEDGNVNVTLRPRQPGSSIKVVNYANALSNGLTPATILNDAPFTFHVDGQEPYTPKNYEGGYRGNISLRNALAESRNIPAVKTLALFGVESMIEMGQKMGITTWENPNNYGLSLTLGGGEVKLLDLATVYATLANYGKRPKLSALLKVTDTNQNVLEEFKCDSINEVDLVKDPKDTDVVSAATESAFNNALNDVQDCQGKQVLDPRIAFIITDILHDNNARSLSFGINSLLVIPNHKEVAVKTGTSNDLRDNLAIGYTQDYVVAVWVGNNNNSPMARISSGVTGATPIWNKIMTALLAQQSNHDWPIPAGLIQVPICSFTGTLACQGCPAKMEWFLEENKPKLACKQEWFNQKAILTPPPQNQNVLLPTQGNDRRNQFLDPILNLRYGKEKKNRR